MQASQIIGCLVVAVFCLTGSQGHADDTGDRRAGIERAAVAAYDSGALEHAAALWREAAEAGSSDAMVALAGLMEDGAVAASRQEAVEWYRRAATLGDRIAMFRLAMIAKEHPRWLGEAGHEWLCRAAAAGHPHAIRILGGGDDARAAR